MLKIDGFVKSPISALRFISLLLRRTISTPHNTSFARLELELFTLPSRILTFYETVKIEDCRMNIDYFVAAPLGGISALLGRSLWRIPIRFNKVRGIRP